MTRTHKEYTTGREAVFGWYPPQYNVYVNPRNQRDYDKECLFRHSQSLYTDKRLVDSPASPALSIQGSGIQQSKSTVLSRPPSGQPNNSQPRPKTTSAVNRKGSSTPIGKPFTPDGLRTPASFSGKIPTPNFQYRPPAYRPHRPTPEKAEVAPSPDIVTSDRKSSSSRKHGWVTQATPVQMSEKHDTNNNKTVPATPHVHFKSALEFYTPRQSYRTPEPKTVDRDTRQAAGTHPFADEDFYDPVSSPEAHVVTPEGMRDSPVSQTGSVSNLSRPRIQSATVRREKTAPPKRSIKSARTARSRPPTASPEEPEIVRVFSTMEPDVKTPTPTPAIDHRPRPPVPCTPEATPVEYDRYTTPDYEDQLDTYGWRVEVHGNPLGIKQVPKRLPYTVKCDNPTIPPNPPKAHMQNYETYFYNTIPRHRATFEVHGEWVSEVLLEKRRESQKKTGHIYRKKNFAFIY